MLTVSLPRSIVFLSPTELNPRSNGHSCILTLAMELKDAGHDVCLLPYQPYRFYRRYWPKLHQRFRQFRFIAHFREAPEGSLLVVPESAPRGLLKKARPYFQQVLWWVLAPSGLLTTYKPAMRPGDLMLPFSTFAFPCHPNYLFIHPPADAELTKANGSYRPHRQQLRSVCFYTGKGRLKALPRPLHRALLGLNIRLITRDYPSTRKGLINLMADSRGLISFDPLTNIFLEAANLGLPVYLTSNPFPPSCFNEFLVDLSTYVTDDAECFIDRLGADGPPQKLSLLRFRSVNRKAVALIQQLFTDPVLMESLRIGPDTLQSIDHYCQSIKDTRTIQTVFNGTALSSGFARLYVRTLKLPYWTHSALCLLLNLIDRVADVLGAIGLFRLLQPFIVFFSTRLFSFGSRLRRLPPISWF